jgi:hypothetical protein
VRQGHPSSNRGIKTPAKRPKFQINKHLSLSIEPAKIFVLKKNKAKVQKIGKSYSLPTKKEAKEATDPPY